MILKPKTAHSIQNDVSVITPRQYIELSATTNYLLLKKPTKSLLHVLIARYWIDKMSWMLPNFIYSKNLSTNPSNITTNISPNAHFPHVALVHQTVFSGLGPYYTDIVMASYTSENGFSNNLRLRNKVGTSSLSPVLSVPISPELVWWNINLTQSWALSLHSTPQSFFISMKISSPTIKTKTNQLDTPKVVETTPKILFHNLKESWQDSSPHHRNKGVTM